MLLLVTKLKTLRNSVQTSVTALKFGIAFLRRMIWNFENPQLRPILLLFLANLDIFESFDTNLFLTLYTCNQGWLSGSEIRRFEINKNRIRVLLVKNSTLQPPYLNFFQWGGGERSDSRILSGIKYRWLYLGGSLSLSLFVIFQIGHCNINNHKYPKCIFCFTFTKYNMYNKCNIQFIQK